MPARTALWAFCCGGAGGAVPAAEANFYDYIPQLTSDLINWQGADEHPEYFSVTSAINGSDTVFTVQPVTDTWPGDVSRLFLRLKIMPRLGGGGARPPCRNFTRHDFAVRLWYVDSHLTQLNLAMKISAHINCVR